MKLSRLLPFFLLVFNCFIAFGQYDVAPGYYLFPIRPGEINYLSGNMGELRGTHFHGGIDIKTSGVTGLKVHASADGYVSRVKVTLGGYGNAVYIQHPNGTTTVYAHLKEFSDPIHRYVLKHQYEKKSFTVDLYPGKNEFKVKKGDVIALSGNSGSSRGPHLHYEIRDKNHLVMDPLKFGFPELKDNVAPIISKIAFISKSPTAKINGKVGRYEFDVKNISGNFILDDAVHLSGKIGIEVYAYDKMNGTRNTYGIPDVDLKINGETIFQQEIRKIPYGKMRDIMVHTNYKVRARGGKRFNKLYVDDGNSLPFYSSQNNGYFDFQDTLKYIVSIELTDPCGNATWFKTFVNSKQSKPFKKHKNDWIINENMMAVSVQDTSRTLDFYANNLRYSLNPTYIAGGKATFLWDLRNGLIDSVDMCDYTAIPNFVQAIYPNQETSFYNHTANLLFPKTSLFDTLYLRYDYSYDSSSNQEIFEFQNREDAIRRFVSVTLKPSNEYNKVYDRVYAVGRKGLNYIGGEWNNDDEITFRTRDFVKYTIASDTVPPKIKISKISRDQIRVKITDDQSGVKSYRAELNGKWIMLRLDAKYGNLSLDPFDPNIPLQGEFILEVEDNTGNLKYFQTKIE